MKRFDMNTLDTVVDNALNSAVFEIQTHLGIDSGDMAGVFFSGQRWDDLKKIMIEYVAFEADSSDGRIVLTR